MKKFLAILLPIFIIIGVGGSFGISSLIEKDNKEWNSALKVDTAEGLDAAFKENCPIYCYGEMVAVDPVSSDALEGTYSFIEMRYQHKSDDGWHTRERSEWHCNTFAFCGREYAYDEIRTPSWTDTTNVKISSHYRNRYSTTPSSFTGVMKYETDGTFEFHPDETIESMAPTSIKTALIVYWVILTVVTGLLIGFKKLNW